MVNCVFHVGNLLLFDKIYFDNILTLDVGLCGGSNTDKTSVYGIPYMAPKVLSTLKQRLYVVLV